ncbi:MAG TPA: serine hydrolase [Vicinamibacterales bacterium]|nr:serine hydrolase [Vicinamibacterales bacterium]
MVAPARALGILMLAAASAAPLGARQAADPALRIELREKTRKQLEAVAAGVDGVVGYVALDLQSGERFERLEGEPFPLASTVKLAILYELFKQADEGRLTLDQPRPLDPRHVVGGSGVLRELTTPSLSLRDHATLMIVLSDNTATNLLIDAVGMDNVNARMRSLGLTTLRLRRKMIDLAAARRGDENVGSPADVATLLAVIHRGEGLRKESADALIAILRKPKASALRDGVPSNVPVANKTGTLEGVAADAGIVYLAERPYVLVVLTTYLKENAAGETAIRTVSRAAFDYFNRVAKGSEYGRVIR